MGLRDFLAAVPRRLRVEERLELGGVEIELRPLSLGELLELWDRTKDALPAMRRFWSTADSPTEERDRSWITPVIAGGFGVLFPELGSARRRAILEAATADELAALFNWYEAAHDWARILREVLGVEIEEDEEEELRPRPEASAIEYLVSLELEENGRRVEELLAMRPEAYLDYLDARSRILERRQRVLEAARRGRKSRRVDSSTFGLGIPGIAVETGQAAGEEDSGG